jgi:spoIIIJ-associated protein
MTPAVRVEASGDTIGEARWSALHELERRHPGLDREKIEFQVVSEGERGLLGVGYEPARVIAILTDVPPPAPASEPAIETDAAAPADADSLVAGRLREMLDAVLRGTGLDARVDIRHEGREVTATLSGDDLGLLIGRHGQTIDALQYLANAAMHRRGEDVEVVIDAQGYRGRRERKLHDVAMRAAQDALETGGPVALEPMTSVERKIVHLRLKDEPGVATASEGAEPNRHVVVLPADAVV